MSKEYNFPYPDQIIPMYKSAFEQGVWKESLTEEEIVRRLEADFSRDNIVGVWRISLDGELEGGSWFYEITSESLRDLKKGEDLEKLIQMAFPEGNLTIVYQSMTVVNPIFQRQGVAREMKQTIDMHLQERSNENNETIFYLTRMRDDNQGIISSNIHLGLQRTGIRMESSQEKGTFHEYWYKVYTPNNCNE